MLSPRIFLFKTESLNFVNLLQFCFLLARDDIYQPCVPVFNKKILNLELGQFAKDLSSCNPDNFRNIDWTTQSYQLDQLLIKTDQPIVMGNHSIKQIDFLKNRYGNQVLSISCSYDSKWYNRALTYLSNMHIYQQSIGTIPLTDLDFQIRKDPTINLVLYYKTAFDQLNLIPKSMYYSTDVVVPCEDFFFKEKFFNHLVNISGVTNNAANLYYNQWYNCQKNFFTKETQYESI